MTHPCRCARVVHLVVRVAAHFLTVGLALTAASALAFQAINVSPDTLRKVDAHMAAALADTGIPGAALVVVHQGRVVLQKGYGVEATGGRPVDDSTAFLLGSVSKSFTALATMRLVEEKKVDLNARLQDYLPWFETAVDPAARRIQVRHLLTHTSGISTYDGHRRMSDEDRSPGAIQRECRRLAGTRLRYPPGERYQYSNCNYELLGGVIETATGQPFDIALEELVLRPLGMSQSFCFRGPSQKGLAVGHRLWFGWPVATTDMPVPHQRWPSGYICSTGADIGRYMIAHLRERGIPGVVSAEGLRELHAPAADIAPGFQYAMGWVVVDWEGQRLVVHEGAVPDYHTQVLLAPDDELGIALMCNGFSVAHAALPLRYAMLNANRILHGKEPLEVPRDWLVTFAMVALAVLIVVMAALTARAVKHAIGSLALQRRTARRRWLLGIPVVIGVLLACLLFGAVPVLYETSFSSVMLFAPDVSWMLITAAVLSIAWGIAHLVVIARLYRADSGQLSSS